MHLLFVEMHAVLVFMPSLVVQHPELSWVSCAVKDEIQSDLLSLFLCQVRKITVERCTETTPATFEKVYEVEVAEMNPLIRFLLTNRATTPPRPKRMPSSCARCCPH